MPHVFPHLTPSHPRKRRDCGGPGAAAASLPPGFPRFEAVRKLARKGSCHSGTACKAGPGNHEHLFSGFSQACVHGFRARGLCPRPGKTSFLNFLTTSFAGGTMPSARHQSKSDPVSLSPSADQGLGNGSPIRLAPRSATQRVRGNEASSRVDEIDDYRRVRSAEPRARIPVGDRGRDCNRYSTRCRSSEVRRLSCRWRRRLLVVSQAVGSGVREGQGRNLSRAVNVRARCD
jgi:hypothetical protein